MPKGGARFRSGPAPDPNALRRDRDGGEWVTLPAEGRKGRTPAWPLPTEATKREQVIWERMWRKPQAVMWERLGQEDEVALYVRRLVEADRHDAPVAVSTLVRQLGDSLGLTTPGMRAARWRLAADEVAERRTPQPRPGDAQPKATGGIRDRFKVVPGGPRAADG